jgi:hypothetical protein
MIIIDNDVRCAALQWKIGDLSRMPYPVKSFIESSSSIRARLAGTKVLIVLLLDIYIRETMTLHWRGDLKGSFMTIAWKS